MKNGFDLIEEFRHSLVALRSDGDEQSIGEILGSLTGWDADLLSLPELIEEMNVTRIACRAFCAATGRNSLIPNVTEFAEALGTVAGLLINYAMLGSRPVGATPTAEYIRARWEALDAAAMEFTAPSVDMALAAKAQWLRRLAQ